MYLISFGIALVLSGGVHLMLQRTGLRPGDPGQLRGLGHGGRTRRQRHPGPQFVYGLAAACAAVGGVLVGLTFDFTPTSGITYLLTGFAVVVLGGLGRSRAPSSERSCSASSRASAPRSSATATAISSVSPRFSSSCRCGRRACSDGWPPRDATRRAGRWRGPAGPIAAALVPGYTGQYGLLVAFEIVQLAALAQAWSLLAGFGGIVSLAVAAFIGVGSYGAAEAAAKAGLGLLPSILAGGLAAVVFALLVAVPMLRFRGLYFTIGSLVLARRWASSCPTSAGSAGTRASLCRHGPLPAGHLPVSLAVAAAATLAVAWMVRVPARPWAEGDPGRRGRRRAGWRAGLPDQARRVPVASFVMGIVGGIQAQRTGYVEPAGRSPWTGRRNRQRGHHRRGRHDHRPAGGLGHIGGPLPGLSGTRRST